MDDRRDHRRRRRTAPHLRALRLIYPLDTATVLEIATYCHVQLQPSKPVTINDKNPKLLVFMKNTEPRKLFKPRNEAFFLFLKKLLGDR